MKKNLIILIIMIIVVAGVFLVLPDSRLIEAPTSVKTETPRYDINTKNNGILTYTSFYNTNKDQLISNYNKTFTVDEYLSDNSYLSSDNYNYSSNVIKLENKQSYTFNLEVEDSGLYEIYFDYYILTSSIIKTEASMMVNDEYQYYEAQQLQFSVDYLPTTTEFVKDRYGNEISPSCELDRKWYMCQSLKDGSLLQDDSLFIYLEGQKINKVSLYIKTGQVLIGNIYLKSKQDLPSYNDYINNYKDSYVNEELIKISPEYIDSKSDLSIRIYSENDISCDRYDSNDRLLNSIYHDTWKKGNQSITWKVVVPKSGLYNISFKYIQYSLINLPVQRTIKVNGKVPYQELECYNFYYSKKWENESLHNEDGLMYVYLNEGENDLTMSVNLEFYRYIIEQLDRIMDEMTSMSLQIKYLTNGQTDEYREWKITDYIPNLPDELNRWVEEIQSLIDYGNTLSNSSNGSSSFANMKLAINKIKKLSENPDRIANELNNFTDGTSSASQLLGNTISSLSENPLGLEMIYLGGENTKLPSPKANFFVRLFESIKRFFISFFNDEYSINDANDEEIEVWVNRSRRHIEIMQQLSDEAGFKVKFSIMPDESKLVLANASGDLPDIAMGVNNWIPYDLAIRGITVDLRTFDGYEEVVSKLTKGALIPYAYDDGMYGIPETQDFWVLYYRSDILGSIGVEVPSTWDDLVKILPKLQSMGLNFYSPISAFTGLKPFVCTLPLLYQYGGSLYSEDGMSTTLGSEENIEALKFMTNLFTIYDVPQEVPNFYNSFRYGTLPIGIANGTTYIQLSIAAPEIQGNWDIALHLGLEQNEEIVRYASTGSQGITMFESSDKKEQSWDFIEWWMSTETQERYIETLYSMYGLEYLHFTANNEAFMSLPISTEHKETIMEQWNWAAEASRIPAAYMIERSISDAYSKVVFNGVNPRIALDDAVIVSNREIVRKMEEFSYMVDGVKIKDYIVPTIYNIDNWLTKKSGD